MSMKTEKWAMIGLLLAAWAPASATVPERVVMDTYEDFARGTSRSVTLSEDGFLAPSPEVKKIGEVEESQLWAVLPDGQGGFWLATGPDGKLMRMDETGKAAMLTKFSEANIYAMAKNKKGELFVGTSPDGKIFKINPKDKPSVYFEPKEKYIWALAFDDKGVLYAATGTNGKIYRITGPNTGTVYYDSDETHIRCLAFDKNGALLAGSSDSGLLYRVTGEGQGIALFSTGQQEINRIAVHPEGTIYFSANGTSKSPSSKASAPSPRTSPAAAMRSLLSVGGEEGEGSKPASAGGGSTVSAKPGGGGSSTLYRLDSSLYAQVLWQSKDTILTLDLIQGQLFAGTSGEGYFYRISERGDATRLFKVEADSITAVANAADGQWVVATSNPSRLFRVGGRRRDPGVYESDVVDSGTFARWGALALKSRGTVQVRTRSGNTPKPDKSWYPWIAPRGDQTQSPPARYLQVELQISEGTLDRLEVVYLPKNLRPSVDNLEILPAGTGYIAIVPPPQPAQAKGADQLLSQALKGESGGGTFSLMPRFQPVEGRSFRTVVWKATDPNGDELAYQLYYRPETNEKWRLLAKDQRETVFSWDTSGWPDGNYYLKVVAGDGSDNAPGEEQTDEQVSKLFTVDNTAPEIQVLTVRNGQIEFTVAEKASSLRSVQVSKDGNEFQPMRPEDGILDSPSERFGTKIAPDEVLFIRAEDEAGNVSGALADPAR
jgi:hypothetical protein